MADRTMQPSEYLTYSCAPAQQIFKPKLQVVTESELPFKLSSEDISMIHKCLNRFVSTSYSPLDDSVFDSFFYYMEFLYKSPTLVLEEKVTDLFGHEYKTFDEAYDKTYKMINKAIDHSLITSEENYSLNSVFRDKQTYKKMYEKAWMKEHSCVHQKFQDKLETSKRTDLHFLTTAELESWIILMKENFVQLKRSAQQFVLKFIGLISQNVNCFLLLQSHAVFDMFYHMFLAQDFTFRSLFVKTLNFLLSHKEGRCYVTQASDMWKAVIQMELQSKESNYYYREILVDFIMNLTIVPHQLVFTNKKIVTQNFFKILSFIDLQSKVHMTFLYKLLQKLLSSYSSTEIAYDDMSSIMRTVEKILCIQIKSPEQLSLDMACTYFQIRTHVDRLSMNYDNEMQTIQSGAHQEFLLKTIWNLECLLNLVVIHIYEHKYDSEDAYNKFLDYAELCCVIYLSRTPAFNSIQPEYNKRNENNNSEEVETCCNTFHNIIKMILFPIFHVLENQLKSYNPTFKFIFNVNLCKTDLKVGLNAENSISAALKSFACFRRIYPLIQQDRFLDTLCRLELQPLLIPLMTKPRWGLFNATPISSYFEHMCNALPECTVEWLRMIEYMCHKERDVFFSFSHMYTLLSCAVHNNQEKIVQTLLTVQQYLLRNYPNHCVLTGTLMEKESDWVVIKLLNSESWIIRDSVLEVLNLDIALRSIQRRAFPKECSDLTKVSSEITRYILLSEKDPERFVRASAVRILHWKLEICVECNFGEAMSDEMVSQKNNLKNVVLDTLFRICYNEEETIVKVQVIDRLCNLYREDDHHEIFELKSSRFHELLEVMKYFAIKDLEHEVKAEALMLFEFRIGAIFENIDEITLDFLWDLIIDMKVLLTILFYDEDIATCLLMCRDMINIIEERLPSNLKVLSQEENVMDSEAKIIFSNDNLRVITRENAHENIRIINIDEIIDVHGELIADRKSSDMCDMTPNNSRADTEALSSQLIGEIISTDDLELLVGNNSKATKPKNRYFSLDSKSSTSSNDKTNFPEFHTKNTFFDETIYTNEDVLCIFLNILSVDYLREIPKRRFGIAVDQSDNTHYKMRSVFNDVLMFDRTLQDNIDCY